MKTIPAVAAIFLAFAHAPAADPKGMSGDFQFTQADEANKVPEFYRLADRTVAYELKPKISLNNAGIDISTLTFPSAVKSASAANNIVHAEYFQPRTPGRHPAVIVLDILDGAQVVSRSEALWLAQHDIPALCVQMAYYGPRREPGSKEKFLTTDIEKSVTNIRQTVLDCRLALAWLETRPEVDPAKLGVVGTSLGSFVGGVFGGIEPKIHSVSLMLGGGSLVESFSEHPIAVALTPVMKLAGVTIPKLKKLIDPIDPITYADALKGKRLQLIAASRDDVVPPIAMKRLWEATGKPNLLWVDANHVGAALYLFPMMRAVIKNIKS